MLSSFNEIQRQDARIWFRIWSSPGLYQTHTMNQDWSTCCFVVVSLFPHVPSSVQILLCPPCSTCWQGFFWSRDRSFLHDWTIPGTCGSGPLNRTSQVSQLTLTTQSVATACAPGPDLAEHAKVTIASPPHRSKLDILCARLKFHISLAPERFSRRLIWSGICFQKICLQN